MAQFWSLPTAEEGLSAPKTLAPLDIVEVDGLNWRTTILHLGRLLAGGVELILPDGRGPFLFKGCVGGKGNRKVKKRSKETHR